ncbi:FAD-dependent monooxygenase [Arthrobacter sp. RIT-PI-e]|uniref:FAD-dependent monooxygenase n=1 Tax=Arthrobacter sp. RIT-PI-e TaxID=1681197 RepID=UPI0006765FB8|nr:FAD-dependent monooxygenase [Arthrobacter sp. RIT-PI-e]
MDPLPFDPLRSASTASSPTERTSTVVIGSGLSGLAVASELSRRGVESIVVESLECFDSGSMRTVVTDSVSLSERTELMRLLRGYAAAHRLDIRQTTIAETLSVIGHPRLIAASMGQKWAVQTADGVLLADHVVLTKYPQNELRRFLRSMGIAIGRDFKETLRAIGLHLVGVGELLTPTTREIVRQAKLVSDAIVAQGPTALQRLTTAPAVSPLSA